MPAKPSYEKFSKGTNPVILQYVTGVQIEFKGDIMPRQSSERPSIFNATERAIVQTEIDKFSTKGVIVPSSPEKGDFVSTIFLRPKRMAVIVLS